MRNLLAACLVAVLGVSAAAQAEIAPDLAAARSELEATRRALEKALVELEAVREELARARSEIDRLRAPLLAPPPREEAAPPPPQRTHTVAPGETLGRIAARYYGAEGEWRRIREANRAIIPNPNRLEVGQVLVIP
jgi:nucleoid-associated protein YgaU